MGDWEEEVWYALFQVGTLSLTLDRFERGVAALMSAYQYRPRRAESLCELARFYRERREYHLAVLFAERARQIPVPDDILFADSSVYRWRALDEFAVSAYRVGRFEEAQSANRELLAGGRLPASEVARVRKNLAFCDAKVGEKPN